MKLSCLVYRSKAVKRFSEQQLVELLTECRENNKRLGITGLLVCKDLDFMQLLEGDEYAVRKLSGKIEKDPRHQAYTELRWEFIPERRYTNWAMGFKNLRNVDLKEVPGYTPFMDELLSSAAFETEPSRAQKLLLLFRENLL